MDLNKIKSFTKEELIQKLNQSGFKEVAKILEDKDVNGQKLIDLREFEIFKWRLNQEQKKILWDCINRIKDKPSILMTQKPKLPTKPALINEKNVQKLDSSKVFKKNLKKLEEFLGEPGKSVGSSSTLPKINRSKPQPPVKDENKKPDGGKQLPPLPPPSPPINKNNKTDKAPLPFKKIPEPDSADLTYLVMNAPPKSEDDDSSCGYLTPSFIPKNVPKKSPSLSSSTNGAIPKQVNIESQFQFKPSFEKGSKKRYDDVDDSYEVSPTITENIHRIVPQGNKNNKNEIQVLDGKLSIEISSNEDFSNDTTNVSSQKTSIKDLKNIIIDETPPQQEPFLSFITSKLNIFKIKKSKGAYENHEIQGQTTKHVEMPVKERPLPKIPSFSTNSIFEKPFPPPRADTPEWENYVELINELTDGNSAVNLQAPDEKMVPEETIEPDQIYGNLPEIGQSTDDPEIYENTANLGNNSITKKSKKIFMKNNDAKEKLPEKIHKLNMNMNVDDQPRKVLDLASLLSQKLMERDQRKQMKDKVGTNASDEEFEDENIYQNYSPNRENESPIQHSRENISPYHNQISNKNRDSPQTNNSSTHSVSDSEFDDEDEDLRIYGNISNEIKEENKNISIQKRVLPPTTKNSPSNTLPRNEPKDENIDLVYDNIPNVGTVPLPKKHSQSIPLPNTKIDIGRKSPSLLTLQDIPQKHLSNTELKTSPTISHRQHSQSIPLPKTQIDIDRKSSNLSTLPNIPQKHSSNAELKTSSTISHKQLSPPINQGIDNDRKSPIQLRPLPEVPKQKTLSTTKLNMSSISKIEQALTKTGNIKKHPQPLHIDRDHPAIQNSRDKPERTQENLENNFDIIINLNNTPFYRETNRKGARELLSKCEDGAFLLRPSRHYFLVLTVKYGRIYNIGVERRPNNKLRLNTEGSEEEPPEFSTVGDLIEHFTREPIIFGREDDFNEIYLKKILPPN